MIIAASSKNNKIAMRHYAVIDHTAATSASTMLMPTFSNPPPAFLITLIFFANLPILCHEHCLRCQNFDNHAQVLKQRVRIQPWTEAAAPSIN
jgi:hypothetical protein